MKKKTIIYHYQVFYRTRRQCGCIAIANHKTLADALKHARVLVAYGFDATVEIRQEAIITDKPLHHAYVKKLWFEYNTVVTSMDSYTYDTTHHCKIIRRFSVSAY
jgi:hypothetical protein